MFQSATDVTSGLDLTAVSSGYTTKTVNNLKTINIVDDDVAGLLFTDDGNSNEINETDTGTLTENGSSLTRYVSLTSQPVESVTVYLETDDLQKACF